MGFHAPDRSETSSSGVCHETAMVRSVFVSNCFVSCILLHDRNTVTELLLRQKLCDTDCLETRNKNTSLSFIKG